uniref:Uncharacterized protein n=1 Tax=Romanomermis culicivorax TaxID=13658 RepID=A0A915JWR6_ROMCU
MKVREMEAREITRDTYGYGYDIDYIRPPKKMALAPQKFREIYTIEEESAFFGCLPIAVFLPFYGQGRCPTYLISPASPPKHEPSNFLVQVRLFHGITNTCKTGVSCCTVSVLPLCL